MKKITLISIFLAFFCLIGFGIYFLLKKQEKRDDTIIFGTASGYAPFVSVNQQGEYEGFDIDVAHAIANVMHKRIKIQDLGSMATLFEALKTGRIDAIIWGLSITKKRLENVAMVHYQGETTTSYAMLFWQKIPNGITSINDMKGMSVCVEPHSSQETVLDKYPLIRKIPIEKVDDSLLFIKTGKADAAFVEPAIAKKFKSQFPKIIMLDVPLSAEDQVQGIGIAIMPTNTEMIALIQSAVTTLTRQGIIEKLEKKWNIF